MSRLEVEAQRAMLPRILGDPGQISETEQGIITQWIVKTLMVMEFTGTPDRRYFTQEDRTRLMENRSIPLLTKAWAGHYTGEGWNLFTAGVQLGDEPKGPPGGVAYTIIAGQLAMQLTTVRQTDARLVRVRVNPGPWRSALIPIWPPAGRSDWPPTVSFSDSGNLTLRRLLDRFNGRPLDLPFPL
jgi:hypothetical protein